MSRKTGCAISTLGSRIALAAEEEAIVPDYDNGFFKKATNPLPGLKIVRVDDLRGGDPQKLGATGVGMLESEAHLSLAVPVADFVKRSLEMMLTTSRAGETPIDLVVGIQEFQLRHKSSILGQSTCGFSARLELRLLGGGVETVVGWLQTESEQDVVFSTLNCQKDAMYSGVAAFAQAIGLGDLPLADLAAQVAGGKAASIEKKTLRVAFRQPWLMGAKFPWEVGGVYYGLAESDMKDPYGTCFGFMAGGVSWFRGRSGIKAAGGYLSGTGKPQLDNPIWTVKESKVSMYVIPLQMSYLYRLRVPDDRSTLVPYVGAGVDVFLGLDRLEATAESATDGFEAHSTALRASAGLHAVLGSEIKLFGDKYSGLLEIKWIQGGKGSTGDLLTDEEKGQFGTTLFDAVNRPKFNFTGWTVELGIRGY